MHYKILVVVRAPENLPEALRPYGHGREWDGYQIGGRWTGAFDGYDPEKDPANIELCQLCDGTGTRPNGERDFGKMWVEQTHGCNGCQGAGKRVKWPTQWNPHPGDCVPVNTVTEEHYDGFYAVCVEEWGWFGGERYVPWDEPKFRRNERPPLSWVKARHPTGFAIVVDCHN